MSRVEYRVELHPTMGPVYVKVRIRRCNDMVNYRVAMWRKPLVKARVIKRITRWKLEETGQLQSVAISREANKLMSSAAAVLWEKRNAGK